MATIDLMDRFGNLGEGGIRNNGTLDAEVMFQSSLRTMRTDFIQVKAGDSIVYKNMSGMSSIWNILSFYTGDAQGSYVSGIAGQTTPQSGVWTAQQDGYVRLFGSFPAGDKISVTMTDLAPDVEDYLSKYNAMNYRFLPNSIPKIVAHIQEYLSNHPIADSTTLQAVIDEAFKSYMEEIQETADTYIAEAVPPAAAAAVDAAASPALEEINAKAAEAAESAREAALSEQSAEMSEENALSYRNQAQQIKDSISSEVAASVLAAQEQATLAQESAQAADQSADNAAQSAATFTTDPTLTIAGKAADAKATGDELSDLNSAINNLLYLPIDETQFISGKYVWSDGKVYNNSNYTLSPYISLGFKKIKFNCLTVGSGIQCVAFYSDETEASFISGYENTASLSTYPQHEMTVPDGAKYIRICKNSTGVYTASVAPWVKSTGTLNEIEKRIDNAQETADDALYKVEHIEPSEVLSDVYTEVYSDVNLIPDTGLLEHSYLNDSGEIKTVSNPSSADYAKCISGYIPVIPGKVLYMSGDNFVYSRFFGFYDESKTYLGGKDTYNGFAYSSHVANHLIPSGAKYLRVTFFSTSDASAAWAGYTGAKPTGEVVNASNGSYVDYHYYPTNPCDFIGRDIGVFNKIACIGDSITSGYFNHSGGGQSIAKYAYPAQLQKMTGVDCVNLGDAGETSVSWWTAHQNDDFSGFDCAIINLGINDALFSTPEADTRTAFANIINALKTANTGIKIFIANINPGYSRGNTKYDAINVIIEDIAENTTDCYFIDLTKYGHTVGTGFVNGHLTATGYRMLAQDYASAISYIISNNPVAFRFVQFIGTNLHN